MLYSRAGDYPRGMEIVYAEGFSPNTPEGACPRATGWDGCTTSPSGSMVPDDWLTIRERAIASWPPAWHGQNLRDILVTLGYDIDRPWRDLPKKDRDWILFTEETPTVPVYAGYTPAETRRALKRKEEPSYMGTFTGARQYVLETFAKTESASMKRRVARFLVSTDCPTCHGKRLKPDALTVKFAGRDIAEMSREPLKRLLRIFRPWADSSAPGGRRWRTTIRRRRWSPAGSPATSSPGSRCCWTSASAISPSSAAPPPSAPASSNASASAPRCKQPVRRGLRAGRAVRRPSPRDTEALLRALDRLKAQGNSIFVVEHELDVMRHADWIVDVGPGAGQHGGQVLYSGPVPGLAEVEDSRTRDYLFASGRRRRECRGSPRAGSAWRASPGTTCTGWTSPSRSACSPP